MGRGLLSRGSKKECHLDLTRHIVSALKARAHLTGFGRPAPQLKLTPHCPTRDFCSFAGTSPQGQSMRGHTLFVSRSSLEKLPLGATSRSLLAQTRGTGVAKASCRLPLSACHVSLTSLPGRAELRDGPMQLGLVSRALCKSPSRLRHLFKQL